MSTSSQNVEEIMMSQQNTRLVPSGISYEYVVDCSKVFSKRPTQDATVPCGYDDVNDDDDDVKTTFTL